MPADISVACPHPRAKSHARARARHPPRAPTCARARYPRACVARGRARARKKDAGQELVDLRWGGEEPLESRTTGSDRRGLVSRTTRSRGRAHGLGERLSRWAEQGASGGHRRRGGGAQVAARAARGRHCRREQADPARTWRAGGRRHRDDPPSDLEGSRRRHGARAPNTSHGSREGGTGRGAGCGRVKGGMGAGNPKIVYIHIVTCGSRMS
jgi:hypothetical protein